ncbi:PREDICTED: bifunctional lysine-specific demethylase and histidyl-hydroxylase NO66-like [Ficedula albicollis]|uniref:bifunctional lysine-specific demethylase and histidyl-hydroxylase NO66-like n=1 Tax=Ficedula albicollis TaxID=59894 RepID=UPI0007AD8A5B|nr:PREDICTED: bifunctional lysine-specific demethylase and histidyl-hydroxylase NO66-like [Ficedula albicollis]
MARGILLLGLLALCVQLQAAPIAEFHGVAPAGWPPPGQLGSTLTLEPEKEPSMVPDNDDGDGDNDNNSSSSHETGDSNSHETDETNSTETGDDGNSADDYDGDGGNKNQLCDGTL